MSFENQIALVTGASRGIGQAILHSLGEKGAYVIGTATSEAGANSISDQLKEKGIAGKGDVLNVGDQESIDKLISALAESDQTPSILVNNAGITRDNLLMRMKEDEWNEILNTNLTSIFRMSKGLMRSMMKARYGRIINIGSVVGSTGNPGQANYCAAKAGMIGFTKSLAKEVGSRGITVNSVAPGFIDTDMTSGLEEKQKEAILNQIALNRLGAPEEIAAAVCFLASKEAGYITGETLHVNGGMYMP